VAVALPLEDLGQPLELLGGQHQILPAEAARYEVGESAQARMLASQADTAVAVGVRRPAASLRRAPRAGDHVVDLARRHRKGVGQLGHLTWRKLDPGSA
jgi:hypothetical protein